MLNKKEFHFQEGCGFVIAGTETERENSRIFDEISGLWFKTKTFRLFGANGNLGWKEPTYTMTGSCFDLNQNSR